MRDVKETRATPHRRGIEKRELVALAAIFLFALALRVYLIRYQRVVQPDSTFYLTLSREIATGNWAKGFHPYAPPIFPLAAAAVARLGMSVEMAGALVSALAGALTLIPAYFLARSLFGARVAVISSILLSFHEAHVRYSTYSLTEILYCLFIVIFLLLAWNAFTKRHRLSLILCGPMLALAALTRPESIWYLPFLAAGLVITRVRSKRLFWSTLGSFLVAIGLFVVLVLPYVVFIRDQTGAWSISAKVDNVWGGGVRREAGEEAGMGEAAQVVAGNWRGFLRRVGHQLYVYYFERVPQVFPPLTLMLVGLGILGRPWERRKGAHFFILAFFSYSLLCYSTTHMRERHMTIFVPVLVIWMALGVERVAEWAVVSFRRSDKASLFPSRKNAFTAAVILLVFLSFLKPLTYPIRRNPYEEPIEYKLAGLWIREHFQEAPPPRVMANFRWPSFYAQAEYIKMPDAGLRELPTLILRSGAELVVVGERGFRWGIGRRKFFVDRLITTPEEFPEFELLAVVGVPEAQAWIFQISR